MEFDAALNQPPAHEDVRSDVDAILWSAKLAGVRRFFHQRYWERETTESEYAARIESTPRLESVAEHSWHMADIVLLISPRFPTVDLNRSLQVAIVHDKMEIIMKDLSPIGRDGKGSKTHAFDIQKRRQKDELERAAIEKYVASLAPSLRAFQEALLVEALDNVTPEARFVKALDRLHPLVFIIMKKRGNMVDGHIRFTLQYARQVADIFPPLEPYYIELRRRLLADVARVRRQRFQEVERRFAPEHQPVPLRLLDDP